MSLAVSAERRPPAPPSGVIRRRGAGTSGWALAAALCSSVFFCPLLTLIGPILGVRALFHINALPGRRGRGLALAGIIVGSLASLWWLVVALWWNANARRPMIEGPRVAMQAGQAGDLPAFKSAFTGAGASASDEEARAFLDELTRRYGPLRLSIQGSAEDRQGPAMTDGRVSIPYELIFSGGSTVQARAEFIVTEPGSLRPTLKFGSIHVIDPQEGDLAYPAAR